MCLNPYVPACICVLISKGNLKFVRIVYVKEREKESVRACVCGRNNFWGVQVTVKVGASGTVGMCDWYLSSK